jgi:putative ABC transport system permease protein
VNYGVHNAVVRSARTEELVNLAATDPGEFAATAPLDDAAFPSGSAKETLDTLAEAPDGILLSREMAGFLKARVGDALHLILARGTPQQAEVNLRLVGLFDHLPGFAEGIDALMPSAIYRETVVNSSPDFFLLRLVDPSDAALDAAIRSLSLSDATLSTRRTTLLRDQSSLAALNIGGLVAIDSGFSMAMGAATVAIFVFGLLLQRRREYVTLRALGMGPASIRWVVSTEIAVAVIVGCLSGIPLGLGIAVYFVRILRPLFILQPPIAVPFDGIAVIIGVIVVAATLTALSAVTLITRLRAAQLLRED